MNQLSRQQEAGRLDGAIGRVLHSMEGEWGGLAVDHTSSWRETILLVEDESFVREVTCEVLRSAGYRVLAAKKAAEASAIYEERGAEVDLLVTDVILPGETGRELGARLRRANSWLKVLYVTGYVEQMSMREGANEDCLAKPFSADVLLERVRRLLDRRGFPTRSEGQATLACAGV